MKSSTSPSKPHLVARIRRENTLLLIVDVQERLMSAMHQSEATVKNCALLARAASQLEIPIVITEHNPARLGSTLEAVQEVAGENEPIPKMLFSACTERTLEAIKATGRNTILICGVEGHVCALQSALDLLDAEYSVFAARDAITSRTPENCMLGWERMMRAGVLPSSTESAIFEWLTEAGTPDFKALLPYLK